jgi:toxin ParE1/3/4
VTSGPGAIWRIRTKAIEDLDGLAAYIQKDSPASAIRFLDAAEETFDLLAQSPELGGRYEVSNSQLASLRVWRVKGFEKLLVFYQRIARGVEIIRVVHGARDLPALFGE